MKSRKDIRKLISQLPKKDVKIGKSIHDRIKLYRERGLISVSIQDFVSNTLEEKLDVLAHGHWEKIMIEKLDEVTTSMGKMSLRITNAEDLKKKVIRLEKKTHTRSRKTKRKK